MHYKRSERVDLSVRPAVLIDPFHKGITIGQTQVTHNTYYAATYYGCVPFYGGHENQTYPH